MKYLILFLTMFIFFTSCFSQNLNFESALLAKNITANLQPINEDSISENDNVLISTSKEFDQSFTSCMRWGTYGTAIGFLYAYYLDSKNECEGGLCGLYVPAGFGLGIISGLIFGTSSDTPQDFDASKFRFGFQWGTNGTIAKERIYRDDYGIVYRRPNMSFYIPDNYYIYFAGKESGDPDYKSNSKLISINNRYGTVVTKTNYTRTFSLMYGLGLGYSSGKIWNRISEPINEKSYKSIYVDLRVGLNINLLKFLHFQWFYKLEPFGPFNSFTHSIAGNLSCYYF